MFYNFFITNEPLIIIILYLFFAVPFLTRLYMRREKLKLITNILEDFVVIEPLVAKLLIIIKAGENSVSLRLKHMNLCTELYLCFSCASLAREAHITKKDSLFLNLTVEELTRFRELLYLITRSLTKITNKRNVTPERISEVFNFVHRTNPTFYLFF